LLFVATAGLALITLGLVVASFRQVRDAVVSIAAAVQSARAAEKSAEAAKLNADAFMNAEGAQLFPVIKTHNLKEVLSLNSVIRVPARSEAILLEPPRISYRFKNYGKTPAKLQSVLHSIEFSDGTKKEYEVSHADDNRALEIIGAGEESADITLEMDANFTREMGIHE
jgi:hypothetical protein